MSGKIYFVIQDYHDKAATIESFTERGFRKWLLQESGIRTIKFLNLIHIPRDMEFIGNWDGLTLVIQGEIIDAEAVFGPTVGEDRKPGPSGSDSTSEEEQSDLRSTEPIMQLELNREDLRPEYYLREAAKVDFRHFTKEAMEKIIAAGGAVFKYGPGCYVKIKIKLPQNRVKPIDPEDVKDTPVPDEVIQVFNDLIQNRWDGKEARIEQSEVLLAICLAMGISKGEVFNKKLLDIEKVFRRAGWEVIYDKPFLSESYPAFFIFSKPN